MLEQYRYTPLPWETKPDTIRLIKLLPGYLWHQIVCIIKQVSLQDKPDYEALSYCWGNADDVQESIIIKDHHGADFSLPVRMNLFAALQQLRDRKESKYVWADAICINQSDLDERRRQVLLMRQIYNGAQETRIWLGRSDENTFKAFSLMYKLVSAHRTQTEKKDTRFYYQLGVKGQMEYGLPDIFDSSFKAFSALLEREWFTRVWIIQEVTVSKVVNIWCGIFSISWENFTNAIAYATSINIPGISWSNTTNCQRIVQLEAARRSVSEECKQSLLSLLILYRNFNATDMRDKIYSLLGISHEVGPDAIQIDPDYTIDAIEVYRRFTVSILEQRRSLDILSVPRVSKASRVGELPSWVADWSVSDFSMTFRFMLNSEQYFLDFKATPSSLAFSPQFREDNSILGLEGHVVDGIEEVGEVHSHHVEAKLNWLQRMGRIAVC